MTMKRLAWLAAIGLGWIVACSPTATTTPDVPTALPPTLPPSPTREVVPTTAPTSAPQQITREMVFQPQPGEWVHGPDDALVTIIEWGDFQ